jgi:CSLREA domain-containing protein
MRCGPAGMLGLAGSAVALAIVAVAPAAAHVYKPTTTADHDPNGCTHGDCTVREAISAANASPEQDTILLKAGKAYKVTHDPSNVEDANAGGDLDLLAGPITIKAKGKGYAVLDAKKGNRVLDVAPAHIVTAATLKGIWVRNGNSTGDGAGIRAGYQGKVNLTLVHSRVTGSKTTAEGGGIEVENQMSSQSNLTLVKSTISGNRSTGSGGGLALVDVNLATIKSSTINGNRAGDALNDSTGGAIYGINNATTVNVTNSTLAGNKSTASGGALDLFNAKAALDGDTIVRNVADFNNNDIGSGGGVRPAAGSTLTVANTVLALNKAGNPGENDCFQSTSTVTPQGRNLFSATPTGCSSFTFPPNIVQSDPHLGKLANNGGPTKTVALLNGSKAIGHAGGGAPLRDQRGVKRDAKPDIGAFERR